MNMIERGRVFAQSLQELAERSLWDWHRCPHCGGSWTIKNGSYQRRPWTLEGRRVVRVQRHLCQGCGKSYAEDAPWLVRGSWYGREVHRCAVDHWVHLRGSLRRIAEELRSWMGRQERWWLWRMWEAGVEGGESCYLSASSIHRWLDGAGRKAEEGISGEWAGVWHSGQFGTDGLWARLRQKGKKVVLVLVDTVTGVVWTTVVAAGEESAESWQKLIERVQEAGLCWGEVSGLVSDGAQGLLSFLRQASSWVHHQRCVWHFWRSMAGEIASAVAQAAVETQDQVREELKGLLHGVIDAASYAAAEEALGRLQGLSYAVRLAQKVNEQLDRLLYPLLACHQGLMRIAPEWLWRDFRLRLSRGRNHGSERRLERAGLLWMVYHNFTPAQWRSERKRKYKHPGLSPLQVAGASPGQISYLDALEV